MAKQVIYFLDEAPGETVEQKAYGVIAEAYRDFGYQSNDFFTELPKSLEEIIKEIFTISGARRIERQPGELPGAPVEWEVTVEGSDENIKEYQDVLKLSE